MTVPYEHVKVTPELDSIRKLIKQFFEEIMADGDGSLTFVNPALPIYQDTIKSIQNISDEKDEGENIKELK